jgi:hypothetical protein
MMKNRKYSSGRQAAREILLLCVTSKMTPERKEQISEILSGHVDWEYLLKLVEFQGVIPVVFHNISGSNLINRVPPSCREHFQKIYNETLYRNVILSDELTTILSAFNEHGIPVIALKGVALAELLYGNLVLRTMVDTDLLVRPDDLRRAGSLLNAMGYRQSTDPDDISHPFHGAPFFKLTTLPFFIELHWDLEDERLITLPREKIWERAQTLQLQWGQTKVLSFEDTLMFSAMQLFKQTEKLKILGDITELLKKYEDCIDWYYIIAAARSWGMGASLYYSLKRAKELLEAPVSLSVIEELKPVWWRRWAIEFLSSREIFLLPVKWKKIRAETLVVIRSLMMSNIKRTLWVLEKYRDRRTSGPAGWVKTTMWMITVLAYAAGRNIAVNIFGER